MAAKGKIGIEFPTEELEAFCRKWLVEELSVFGSALREDFRDDSDVDVLVRFAPDAQWDLFDWVDMAAELETIAGREVDLVAETGLRNPFRRAEIMSSREIVYAA